MFFKKIRKGDSDKWKLSFAARPDDILDYKDNKSEGESGDESRISHAQKILKDRIATESEKQKEFRNHFLNYLQDKVHLVVTEIPAQADLNKIFELVNGRGAQLLQHQILKAKILEKIDNTNNQRVLCGHLWDMCAQMDKFFIDNVKGVLGNKNMSDKKGFTWKEFFEKFKESEISWQGPRNIEKILEVSEGILFSNNSGETAEHADSAVSNNDEVSGRHIADICKDKSASSNNDRGQLNNDDEHDEVDDGDYQSIISFSTFLLYVLAVYKKSSGSFLGRKRNLFHRRRSH